MVARMDLAHLNTRRGAFTSRATDTSRSQLSARPPTHITRHMSLGTCIHCGQMHRSRERTKGLETWVLVTAERRCTGVQGPLHTIQVRFHVVCGCGCKQNLPLLQQDSAWAKSHGKISPGPIPTSDPQDPPPLVLRGPQPLHPEFPSLVTRNPHF